MSTDQRNTVWRFAIIFIAIFLGFAAVVGRIIYVQTVERDQWLSVAVHQDPVYQPIPPTRGNILDCNGHLLASSMPRYMMYMDTNVPALQQNEGKLLYAHIDSLAYDLAKVVGSFSQAEYKKRILAAYKNKESRLDLNNKRSINYLQRQALEKNSLIKKGRYKSGIFYEERHERINPYGKLARRTIGQIYGDGGSGNAGLEKRFDKELRGIEGAMRIERIGGRKESITVQEAQDGMESPHRESVRERGAMGLLYPDGDADGLYPRDRQCGPQRRRDLLRATQPRRDACRSGIDLQDRLVGSDA